jgi:hypothetical protein
LEFDLCGFVIADGSPFHIPEVLKPIHQSLYTHTVFLCQLWNKVFVVKIKRRSPREIVLQEPLRHQDLSSKEIRLFLGVVHALTRNVVPETYGWKCAIDVQLLMIVQKQMREFVCHREILADRRMLCVHANHLLGGVAVEEAREIALQ